jgi:hypothetical protein
MLDVAVWDFSQPIPELSLSGSVELEWSPTKWRYAQLMGQLVGQAFVKRAAGRIEQNETIR